MAKASKPHIQPNPYTDQVSQEEFDHWIFSNITPNPNSNKIQHGIMKDTLRILYQDPLCKPLIDLLVIKNCKIKIVDMPGLGGGCDVNSNCIYINPRLIGYTASTQTFLTKILMHEIAHFALDKVYQSHHRLDPIHKAQFNAFFTSMKPYNLKDVELPIVRNCLFKLMHTDFVWQGDSGGLPKNQTRERIAELIALQRVITELPPHEKAHYSQVINYIFPPQDGISILDFAKIIPKEVDIANKNFKSSVHIETDFSTEQEEMANNRVKKLINYVLLTTPNPNLIKYAELIAGDKIPTPKTVLEEPLPARLQTKEGRDDKLTPESKKAVIIEARKYFKLLEESQEFKDWEAAQLNKDDKQTWQAIAQEKSSRPSRPSL